jgi:hypothetical protein
MRARRLLPLPFLLVSLGAATSARAGEPGVHPLRGRLYADLGGYVSVPSGPMTRDFDQTTGGGSFQFGIGLKGIPATLGISAHQTGLGSTTWSTGEAGYYSYGGRSGFGYLDLHRTLDVRGADLVFRLEPERWRVRPFLEIRGGFLQIHCTYRLSATVNGELYAEEETGNITWSWGYGGGFRIEVYRLPPTPTGDLALTVSLGVRRVFAGNLRYLQPQGSDVGGVRTYGFSIDQPPFRAIEPFLLLGFESRSQ